ncbi:MAG: response regulator [Candidatus Sericytochromatia bacterium]
MIRTKDLEKVKSLNNIFSYYLSKPIKYSQLPYLLSSSFTNNYNNISNTNKVTIKLDSDFSLNYPLKILMAEDNPINQKLAIKVFEKMGYKIDIVNNGLEVIEKLKTYNYDLIFMDIQMPEMDGIETTRYLIKKYNENKPIIIALTANAMSGDKENYLKVGMNDYISKPISLNILQGILIKWHNIINKSS